MVAECRVHKLQRVELLDRKGRFWYISHSFLRGKLDLKFGGGKRAFLLALSLISVRSVDAAGYKTALPVTFAAADGTYVAPVSNSRKKIAAFSKKGSRSELVEQKDLLFVLDQVYSEHFRMIPSAADLAARLNRASCRLFEYLEPKQPIHHVKPLAKDTGERVVLNARFALEIRRLLNDAVTTQQIWDAVTKAFLADMDPHSLLYTGRELERKSVIWTGKKSGSGVEFALDKKGSSVVTALDEGSPAEYSGLAVGDKIVSLQNEGEEEFPLKGKTQLEIEDALRGSKEKAVLFTVVKSSGKTESIRITRKEYEARFVKAKELDGGILYVSMSSFGVGVGDQLRTVLEHFPNAKGIILDLRWNRGGMTNEAAKVADLFISKGLVAAEIDRFGQVISNSKKMAVDDGEFTQPMVIQINDVSASSSEIVAQSLSSTDFGRAAIVGRPSFGKGSGQDLLELPSKRGTVGITTFVYVTRSGISPQLKGVIPDFPVRDPYFERLHRERRIRLKRGEKPNVIREIDYPGAIPALSDLGRNFRRPVLEKAPSNPLRMLLSKIPFTILDAVNDLKDDLGLKTSVAVLKELMARCPTYRVDGCKVPSGR
jgi:carboxyl-terminal processing protease